jgi:hypothetical protein
MISAFFTGQVGDIEVNIDDSGSPVTADIVSMGSLRYDFDQTPDTLNIDRVQAVYSPFNIEIGRFDDDGNDLYFRLIQATVTGGVASKINVDMQITDFQSNVFKFTFDLRNSDIETDERSRSVKLKLNPRLNLETNNEALFGSITGFLPFEAIIPLDPATNTSSNVTYNCVGVADYIESALPLMFGNDFDNPIISSGKFVRGGKSIDLFGKTPTTNDDERFYMVNVSSEDGFIANGEQVPETPGVGLVTVNSTSRQRNFLNLSGDALAPITEIYPSFPNANATVQIIGSNGADFSGLNEGNIIIVDSQEWEVAEVVDSTTVNGRNLKDQRVRALPPFNTLIDFAADISTTEGTITFGAGEVTFEDLGYTTQYAVNRPYTITKKIVPEEIKVIDTLKGLAGIEGSIFGTGFSKNFYINRESVNPADAVTILFDDVINLKPKPFNLAIGGSKVTQLTDSRLLSPDLFGVWGTSFTDPINVQPRIPNLQSATKYTVGNPNATKAIEIELPAGYPFLNKGLAVGGEDPVDPVLNIEAITLRYNEFDGGASCGATGATYYANNAISLGFEGIIDLFQNESGDVLADSGWYSNGTIVRYWNNNSGGELSNPAFTQQFDCASFPGEL